MAHKIDSDVCDGCGACVDTCAHDAILVRSHYGQWLYMAPRCFKWVA